MDVTVRPALPADEAGVVALWRACGLLAPYNDPVVDFRSARGGTSSDVLVGADAEGRILASVMVGHDGHRGWLYYVACAPGARGEGLGRQVVRAAEAWLAGRGVGKVQLMVRQANAGVMGFYERLGYEETPRIVMARWIGAAAGDP